MGVLFGFWEQSLSGEYFFVFSPPGKPLDAKSKGVPLLKIIRKINNNAAIAQDKKGREMVVLGRGVGFPAVPYELTDLSAIYRTYYDVNPKYFGLAGELPPEIILAATEIAEQAEFQLDCELNPNLPFTLADHLNFAIERHSKGIQTAAPLGYDVRHLYPQESALGVQALDLVEKRMGVRLPDAEAISVALHIVSAELESSGLDSMMRTFGIINDIDRIVEDRLNIRLDRDSYNYSRFAVHLQYLIQRLENGVQTEEKNADILHQMAREYPALYRCASEVCEYLEHSHGWRCNREELLYLMLHINRVQSREK